MKTHTHKGKFPGFPPEPVTNYWPYPKALNGWWHALSPSEQKVLDYILRHTWGYKKTADAIALSQFIGGITKRDGTILDAGTGIKNEKTIRKALKGLEEKGFIQCKPVIGEQTIYKLTINPSQKMVPVSNTGTSPLPESGNRAPSQTLAPTINDISIKNINSIPASQDSNKLNNGKIQELIRYLATKLGCTFPNYGKQARYTKSILDSGYTEDDVKWAIDLMLQDKWWSQYSFDMKNVADEIPKLMTRTYKGGDKKHV